VFPSIWEALINIHWRAHTGIATYGNQNLSVGPNVIRRLLCAPLLK
jgi:hypothetical protein